MFSENDNPPSPVASGSQTADVSVPVSRPDAATSSATAQASQIRPFSSTVPWQPTAADPAWSWAPAPSANAHPACEPSTSVLNSIPEVSDNDPSVKSAVVVGTTSLAPVLEKSVDLPSASDASGGCAPAQAASAVVDAQLTLPNTTAEIIPPASSASAFPTPAVAASAGLKPAVQSHGSLSAVALQQRSLGSHGAPVAATPDNAVTSVPAAPQRPLAPRPAASRTTARSSEVQSTSEDAGHVHGYRVLSAWQRSASPVDDWQAESVSAYLPSTSFVTQSPRSRAPDVASILSH